MSSSSFPQATSSTSGGLPPNAYQSSGYRDSASTQTGRTAASHLDRHSAYFSINAWVLAVAVVGMLPVASNSLSIKAYRLSLLGTTCSSVYSLYVLYGKPRSWNLPVIRVWFRPVMATKDFIHLIYCLILVSSQLHFKFALVPVFCWALEHVARFLRLNFGQSLLYRRYLQATCLWVEANGTMLNFLSSHAEIGLGFLLLISLLSWQRNVMQTFMYWQLLKIMYMTPPLAGYHQSIWVKIGRTVNPYIHQYAPFLNSPISMIQRWWFR